MKASLVYGYDEPGAESLIPTDNAAIAEGIRMSLIWFTNNRLPRESATTGSEEFKNVSVSIAPSRLAVGPGRVGLFSRPTRPDPPL